MTEPLKEGQKYGCPEGSCGSQILVIKGCEKCPAESPQPPTCCCGKPMVKA